MEQVMENKDIVKYQWKKGDDFGKIVELSDDDGTFLNFTDGSKIFKKVAPEFLEVIENGVIPFPSPTVVDSSLNKIAKKSDIVVEQSVVKEATIMGKMITKMSKKNVVNVPLKINLNIPTPVLYAMLSEGMEEDDLNEEIMSVALSQIETDKLQEYIKTNITDFLTEYYA